jgi:DNA-binding NarL/FixJ family response regulator
VVVDDHTTFSDLLALALAAEPDLECVATASTAAEGISIVEAVRPDVVVMDVHLGADDGIDTTATLVARNPRLKVVVLTAHADREVLRRVSDAGACALLPKDGSLPEVLAALRNARVGGLVVHPRLLRHIVSSAAPARQTHLSPLTRRENEVLQLLAEGLDARAVARRLGITLHTCRGYIKTLLVKLEAHSQLEAVANASRRGLVDARSAS